MVGRSTSRSRSRWARREGSSVRGGALGHLHEGALADTAAVDKVIDAAVASVAARRGISVAPPSSGGGGGATIDAAALSEFTDQITGRHGVLASAARLVLDQLGLDDPVTTPPAASDAELIEQVIAELGSEWPRLVAPVFDAKKVVAFDDRWASAREDLVKIWLDDDDEIDAEWPRLSERFEGVGHVVATQATWWQGKALAAGRNIHASLYARIAAGAEDPDPGPYSNEIAVVTGASKGSIAASVVAQLLDGWGDGHRHHVQARRRAPGVLPHSLPRPRPLRRVLVGGVGQHGLVFRYRRTGRNGSATSRPKTLVRSRFRSKAAKSRRCCSPSRRRGSPVTFRRPVPALRWR